MSRKRNWWENNEFMEWSDNHPMLGSETTDDEVVDKSPGAGKNSSGGVYIAQDYSKNPYDTTNKDISTKFFVYKDENSVIGGDEPRQVTVLNGNSKRNYLNSRDPRTRFAIQNNRTGYQDRDHEVPFGPDDDSNKSKTLEEWLRLNRQQQKKNSSESSGQRGNSSSGSGCDCDKKKEEEKKTGQQIGEKAAQAGNTASVGGASASGASSTSSGGTGSSTSGANSQGEDGCDCSGGGSGSGSSDSVKESEAIESPFGTFLSRLESVLDSRRSRGSGLIASIGKFDGLELANMDDYTKSANQGDYIPSYVNMRDGYSEIGDAIKVLLNKSATYKNVLKLFNENSIYHNSNITFIVRTDREMTVLHDRYSSTPLLPDEKEYGNTMVYIKTNGRLKPIQTCTEDDLRRFERFEIQISISQDCDYLKAALTLPHEIIVHALKFAEIIADNQNFPDVQRKMQRILGENQAVHHATEFMNSKSNYYKVCMEMLDALKADPNYWNAAVMDRGIFDSIGAVYPEEHSGEVPNYSTYNYLILEIMGAAQHYGISPQYILSLFPFRTYFRGRR